MENQEKQSQDNLKIGKKGYKMWIIIILLFVLIGGSVVSYTMITKNKENNEIKTGEQDVNRQQDVVNQEENNNKEIDNPKDSKEIIKERIEAYYKLLGEREFGEAYDYISGSSNISKVDYVDEKSEKGDFVENFEGISFNYVEISDDIAVASATVKWNLIENPFTDKDVNTQSEKINLVLEEGLWKIVDKKDKEDEGDDDKTSE